MSRKKYKKKYKWNVEQKYLITNNCYKYLHSI